MNRYTQWIQRMMTKGCDPVELVMFGKTKFSEINIQLNNILTY